MTRTIHVLFPRGHRIGTPTVRDDGDGLRIGVTPWLTAGPAF
jgi:hypothetical protein